MEQNFNNVRLTEAQVRDIERWADNEDPPQGPLGSIISAGNERDAIRLAHRHGARLIAEMFAAGYLEPGQDPVEAFDSVVHGEPKLKRRRAARRP